MTKIIYREHQEVSDANSTENDIPIAANFSAGNFPEKWKISENILHGESKITISRVPDFVDLAKFLLQVFL